MKDHDFENSMNDEIDRGGTNTPKATIPATVKTPSRAGKLVNPFAFYGEQEGSSSFFSGDYLTLDQKLGYLRGQDKKPVDVTQKYVTNMMSARHGYVKFPAKGSDERAEYDIYLICEEPRLLPCKTCGRTAKEHDDDQKACDWRPAVYLQVRPFNNANDVLCFSGGGKGARVAVAELCKLYGRPGADRGGHDFLIMLETRSFKNASGGTTVWPVLRQIGLEYFIPGTPAPEAQVVELLPVKPVKPALVDARRNNMDDEIHFE
jgi:hypothetical protein